MSEKKYRKNVGIMLVNSNGEVWLGERINSQNLEYKYQMPQGGLDEDENPLVGAYRELFEETGIQKDKVELLKQSDEWRSYDFPQPISYGGVIYYGQTQLWFLFRFKGNDTDFNLTVHPEEIEFSSFFWSSIEDIMNYVVPFKKDVYRKVVDEFKPYI